MISQNSPESCWSRFASKVDFPITLSCLKPFSASWRIIEERIWLFMMYSQIYQITFTNPIPLNPLPLSIVAPSSSMSEPLWGAPIRTTVSSNLPIFYYCCVLGSFYHVESLSPSCRCLALIPDQPPIWPVQIPRASIDISFPPGGPSGISSGCTSISIDAPSEGRHLYRFSLRVEVWSRPSLVEDGKLMKDFMYFSY